MSWIIWIVLTGLNLPGNVTVESAYLTFDSEETCREFLGDPPESIEVLQVPEPCQPHLSSKGNKE